jgi:flagellar protein FliJ
MASKKSRGTHKLPKFNFSLETLLRHRDDIEQKERDELLRLTYRFETELRHHDELTAKFRETMKDLSVKRAGNATDQDMNWFYRYLDRLTHEIGESEKYLSRLQSEAQAQKEVVIEASKKKKVLASLKSKKEREFLVEVEKQEQKNIDDLVITRYRPGESANQTAADGRKRGK